MLTTLRRYYVVIYPVCYWVWCEAFWCLFGSFTQFLIPFFGTYLTLVKSSSSEMATTFAFHDESRGRILQSQAKETPVHTSLQTNLTVLLCPRTDNLIPQAKYTIVLLKQHTERWKLELKNKISACNCYNFCFSKFFLFKFWAASLNCLGTISFRGIFHYPQLSVRTHDFIIIIVLIMVTVE